MVEIYFVSWRREIKKRREQTLAGRMNFGGAGVPVPLMAFPFDPSFRPFPEFSTVDFQGRKSPFFPVAFVCCCAKNILCGIQARV
jgi:hypothetical protein